MTDEPRGIRNANPGNVRWGSPWQGLVPDAQRTDKDFCQFITPAYGIRALCRILITYQDNYGLNTIQGIISRWAPPNENNTPAYIEAVAATSGFGSQVPLDMHKYDDLLPIVKGIIQHENGQQPYDQITLDKGLQLAGVTRNITAAAQTPTGKLQIGVIATGGAAAVIQGVQQAQPVITAFQQATDMSAGLPQWLRLASVVLVVGCIVFAGVTYWRKHREVKS